MRRWQRFIPHSYWLMASAAILLVVIGIRLVILWQHGVIGDWAIFYFGLVAVIVLAVFAMMLLTYRRDQLYPAFFLTVPRLHGRNILTSRGTPNPEHRTGHSASSYGGKRTGEGEVPCVAVSS